ncbi:hypothetical protein [Streptomyces stelliscabiei]|uniref:hypothetical protein n=1 Tax=Streptomyces stelliscabiei TaxID=146820 RepID=UPI0029BAF0D8|nr:hypothetical protein [Streptomyces stelliscabiei]MDX2550204.1 hypothetical protein [Streptomyces stelliscabiei]MDX2610497.1 hypothetical protein [Streptomyces stelliscabiei]MDX2635414.1 hypothetical protein [Streptomyces stelliscabiei]MDX2665687.1 hypothetical protein [Streptomyces stelliscabiei]MDX2710554.1 hypothetical protein [Streptomyces stelliscabiei]
MTNTPIELTGTGAEGDPLWFDATRPQSAPDPVVTAVAGLARTARSHAAEFSAATTGLPADLREIVNNASTAITSTLSTAAHARARAESFLNDVKLYPEGRKMLAGEALKAADDTIAESLAQADAQIEVASALTYEAARPRVGADAAMTARADLQMMTQRHSGNPGALIDTLKRLAQRGDSVGALIADQSFLGDFMDSHGIDQQTHEAVLTLVRSEVVRAAAESGDPNRAAAGKANIALVELRKARVAATSFTRHVLSR